MIDQLLAIADQPQQVSNAALSAAEHGLGAHVLQRLADKLVENMDSAKLQEVANMFLALHRSGVSTTPNVAQELVIGYVSLLDKQSAIPYAHVQVLTGLERHGVSASAIDLQPIVGALVQQCRGQKDKLPGVVASLKAMGYGNQQHLQHLESMAQSTAKS